MMNLEAKLRNLFKQRTRTVFSSSISHGATDKRPVVLPSSQRYCHSPRDKF